MLGKKVRERRLALQLTQEQVVRIAGVSRPRIAEIEAAEDANVTQETLYGLAKALQLAPDILAGKEALNSLSTPMQIVPLLPIAIPIIAEGSAGEGDGLVEYAYWARPRAVGRNIRGVIVKGDCLEPEVRSGDVLFADADLSPKDGNLVICFLEGKIQVKRYRAEKGRVWLENRYKEFRPEDCVIQGVVIERNVRMR